MDSIAKATPPEPNVVSLSLENVQPAAPPPKAPSTSHTGKIQVPMALQKPKFQPTPVGIIYEEISLLDAFDDNSGIIDFPSLFESQIIASQYTSPISESALELQAKPENRTKVGSHMKKRLENKKQPDFIQNVGSSSTKESSGKRFKFDEKKAAQQLHSTKLKNFLVHAGGNSKNAGKVDHLAGSFNNNAATIPVSIPSSIIPNSTIPNNAISTIPNIKKEAMVKTGVKFNDLLAGAQTNYSNVTVKNGNLPLLKPPSQLKKELVKTSYFPFFGASSNEMRLEDIQQSAEHSNGTMHTGKLRRPKSGENTTATLKKIYIGNKDKSRKVVWNPPPGVNA